MFPLFMKRNTDVLSQTPPPSILVSCSGSFFILLVSIAGDEPISLQFQQVLLPLLFRVCCQLPSYLFNTSVVKGILASGIYGMQWFISTSLCIWMDLVKCHLSPVNTCDVLLRVSHTLQSALESGRLISVQSLIGSTPFWRNTYFWLIRNSIRHLHSCSDSAHLQKTYPNSVPSNGANISTVIELDHWTIS